MLQSFQRFIIHPHLHSSYANKLFLICNNTQSLSQFSLQHKTMDSSKKVITIVTGNANKLKEINTILGESFPYELVTNGADLPEYQGDADTVSRQKCESAYSIIKGPVIVEDTCLCFDALNGLPGPYVKWFLKSIGPEGLHKMLAGFEDHSAKAMATLAYCDSDKGEVILFKGITAGTIVEPRGQGGFGWDTCFQPSGYDKTYAEMSADEKNAISHRKRAIEAMRDYFINKSKN
ncbi:inosine triphosphate pyrophosphatase [Folsomia candida]|uniref:Inosine triphosphate pyrophosphatase n=1 Tax=Folsomia candida TaxID=158441 RepID=A0A226EMS2_FOLCA|nr:inosine triphosphate pyrophosphatase [Folsomia candida]OXA57866.1 Inosine triphosphate pyrophosphatase [Folsomia candida]